MSDECDEKRSFTPQPRLDSMLFVSKKLSTYHLNRGAEFQYQGNPYGFNRSMIGLNNRSVLLNKSNNDISCINNKSECISDNDISQFVSRDKRNMRLNGNLNTEMPFYENK